ncbi:MAG: hypothetical protein QXL01_00100 [Thermoplasmatales archaeon]
MIVVTRSGGRIEGNVVEITDENLNGFNKMKEIVSNFKSLSYLSLESGSEDYLIHPDDISYVIFQKHDDNKPF